jgi:gluconate 5-dehydrogenase
MIPEGVEVDVRARLLDAGIMGPPIVWLASEDAGGVHDQRIVATQFEEWLADRAP